MNMMKVIAVPMHPEGRKFVAIFAAVTAALWLVWEPLFWLGLGLTIWCYYFFRGVFDHEDRAAIRYATGR
jgi:phosphatidylserine decarboxylase